MDGLALAVIVAALVALLLFAVYLVARRRERGWDPRYAREVYLYRPSQPRTGAAPAAPMGAVVATEGQVSVYAASGGRASGCGLVAEGRALGVGGSPPRPSASGCGRRADGVWLYGPKPRRGTPGVEPFGPGGCWFQPS